LGLSTGLEFVGLLVIRVSRVAVGPAQPLGIVTLLLVIVRVVVCISTQAPPLAADRPSWPVLSAKLSHYLWYALMLAMPLIG
jgi:cytochrome b561